PPPPAAGADIVVGSEMMLCPYISSDSLFEDDAYVKAVSDAAVYIGKQSKDIAAVLIFGGIAINDPPQPEYRNEDGRIRKYNAAFIAQAGRFIRNKYKIPYAIKSLHPNYRVFDDARHFYCQRKLALEWRAPFEDLLQPFTVTIRGEEYNLGVMLCEDMWDIDYPQKPSQILAANGADILINLSCSPWSWHKNQKRDAVVRAICRQTGLPFVYVNNVGCMNNGKNFITFDGASTIYNSDGDIVAMTKLYEVETKIVTLRDHLLPMGREEEDDIEQLFAAIKVAAQTHWDMSPPQNRNKVVIGVSGGIDSALSVAFYAYLLGSDRVLAVNMPYKNFNAEETKNDAAELCRRIGVEYRVVPIDDVVDTLCALADIEVGTSPHKTTQAITRMNILASISTSVGGWFTCNANWTEIAFGYGTLNADLRGYFNPWGNCRKADVYRLANFMNTLHWRYGMIPQSIINRPPMDELTASGAGERKDPFDYGSVTENGYHDQMVRAIVAFRFNAETFLEAYMDGTLEEKLQLSAGRIKNLFPTCQAFVGDLERCFTLFHAAVHKRVQSVPMPLVDKRSFGWDFRESMLPWHPTTRYLKLKSQVLGTE
ncbi:MAG: NAD(+) synthase, partial [Patescibacteria group bacterium]